MGSPKAAALGANKVLTAFESVLLLSSGLGCLSPVHDAEEQAAAALSGWRTTPAWRLFSARWRRGLPQERKHPSWGLHEQRDAWAAPAAPAPGWGVMWAQL